MLTRRHICASLTAGALTMAGCVAPPPPSPSPGGAQPMEIGGGVKIALPAAPGFPGAADLSQLIRTARDGRVLIVQSDVSLRPDRVVILFSPPGGPPAMTIVWDRDGVAVSKEPTAPAALNGRRILADMFLTHWPVEAVRPHIVAGRIDMVEGARRIAALDGDPVMTIDFEPKPSGEVIRLRNLKQEYELTITSRRAAS